MFNDSLETVRDIYV